MKIITFVTQKGGSGKTTSLVNFAVAAAQNKKNKVLIIDLDPQRSTISWWETREHDNIGALDIAPKDLEKGIAAAKKKGINYIFIDTPARAEAINSKAISVADFCILPCQPSLVDMQSAKATVASIEKLNKKGAFLVNRAHPRGYRVGDAVEALKIHGLPVCPLPAVDRASYKDAYAYGEGVIEFEPGGKAAKETQAIWQWLVKKMDKKAGI